MPTEGQGLYGLACVRALSAEGLSGAARRHEEDLALQALQQAVAKGFRDVGHLKQDSDLKVLHGRPEFQQLVRDLEANAEPKKKK
jgi:hypothetical protein